jgi:sorbose reductase
MVLGQITNRSTAPNSTANPHETVTGGAGTLALSSARALLDHGLRGLALWDIAFSPEAEADIERLQDEYPDAIIVPIDVDIREEKSVEMAMEATKKALSSSDAGGAINVLICFAGVVSCINAVDMSYEEWRRVMDINCTGGFLCAKIVARYSPLPFFLYYCLGFDANPYKI